MIKIGITGQNGFIGRHLFNNLGLHPAKFERVLFTRDFFESADSLDEFVSKCDVIIHLAAINRNDNQEILYETNLSLTSKLLDALNRTKVKPAVIFSSSTQEELNNLYGKSKKEARELIEAWAIENGAPFAGLIIPNVFGPFGKPFYNSVIATFCYQLANNDHPEVKSDNYINFIYVDDLVKQILQKAEYLVTSVKQESVIINATDEIRISELLSILQNFKSQYLNDGNIPSLQSQFEVNLFNTFRSFISLDKLFPRKMTLNTDNRGIFVEIIRLGTGGQISFSTTKPGVVRGNHFHTRKIERFSVIKGSALIQLRKMDSTELFEFHLDGENPAYVDMPIWYTHNIKNTGNEDLYTIFWINEFYNPNDPDTFFLTV